MNIHRAICTGVLVCLLAAPILAGGNIPEQPPVEPTPVDQSGGFGQGGGAIQSGGAVQSGPVESGPVDQSGTDGQGGFGQSGTCTQGGQTQGYPGQDGYGQNGYGQASPQDFAVLVTMLNLVASDLEMCRLSIQSSHHYVQNVLAIGYLNNARSALSRTSMHPAYQPLLAEISQRLDRIKFFLVMNDESTVVMMLSQLGATIRSVIMNQGGGQVQYSQPGFTSTGVTTGPAMPVSPVYPPIYTGGWGQGQNIQPPTQGLPLGLIPVSDPH